MIDYDISHSDYLALDKLSASGIKQLLRSPAHYREAIEHPTPASPQQLLGTLVHAAVLEPERTIMRVMPAVDGRTKAGKEAKAAFNAELPADCHAVDAETYDTVYRMRDAVLENRYANILLSDGKPEVSIFWDDNGIECKARIDWLCGGHEVLLDLKTAQDAGYEGFAKACGSFQYHAQDSWYRRGAAAVGLGNRAFIFLVIENKPPHAVALYQLDDQARQAGEARIIRAIDIYRQCKESGEWPGYEPEIQSLSLPKWAL